MTNDSRHLAIHEAGHAVVGRALSLLCGQATIIADEDSAGHHIVHSPNAIQYHWERLGRWIDPAVIVRARAMTFMAGREAEEELLGHCQGGDGDDRYWVAQMIESFAAEDDVERWDARLRRHAREVVRRHRPRIEHVAAALELRGTLSGEQIDAECRFDRVPYPMRYDMGWIDG